MSQNSGGPFVVMTNAIAKDTITKEIQDLKLPIKFDGENFCVADEGSSRSLAAPPGLYSLESLDEMGKNGPKGQGKAAKNCGKQGGGEHLRGAQKGLVTRAERRARNGAVDSWALARTDKTQMTSQEQVLGWRWCNVSEEELFHISDLRKSKEAIFRLHQVMDDLVEDHIYKVETKDIEELPMKLPAPPLTPTAAMSPFMTPSPGHRPHQVNGQQLQETMNCQWAAQQGPVAMQAVPHWPFWQPLGPPQYPQHGQQVGMSPMTQHGQQVGLPPMTQPGQQVALSPLTQPGQQVGMSPMTQLPPGQQPPGHIVQGQAMMSHMQHGPILDAHGHMMQPVGPTAQPPPQLLPPPQTHEAQGQAKHDQAPSDEKDRDSEASSVVSTTDDEDGMKKLSGADRYAVQKHVDVLLRLIETWSSLLTHAETQNQDLETVWKVMETASSEMPMVTPETSRLHSLIRGTQRFERTVAARQDAIKIAKKDFSQLDANPALVKVSKQMVLTQCQKKSAFTKLLPYASFVLEHMQISQ